MRKNALTASDDLKMGFDAKAEVRAYHEGQRLRTRRARVAPIDQIITASLMNAGRVADVGMLSRSGVGVQWVHEHRSLLDDAFGLPSLGSESLDDPKVSQTRGIPDPTARRALTMLEPSATTRQEVFDDLIHWHAERLRRTLVTSADDIVSMAEALEVGMADDLTLVRTRAIDLPWFPIPTLATAMRIYDHETTKSVPLGVRRKRASDADNGACLFLSSDVDDEYDEITGQWYSPEMRATMADDVHDGGVEASVRTSWRDHLVHDHGLEAKPDDDDPHTLSRRCNWHLAKRLMMDECLASCQGGWSNEG